MMLFAKKNEEFQNIVDTVHTRMCRVEAVCSPQHAARAKDSAQRIFRSLPSALFAEPLADVPLAARRQRAPGSVSVYSVRPHDLLGGVPRAQWLPAATTPQWLRPRGLFGERRHQLLSSSMLHRIGLHTRFKHAVHRCVTRFFVFVHCFRLVSFGCFLSVLSEC